MTIESPFLPLYPYSLPITSRLSAYRICLIRHLPAWTCSSIRMRTFLLVSLPRSIGLRRCRNFNLLSISYAPSPRIRSRLTPGRRSLPGNPSAFGGKDSHLSFRYSYRHSRFLSVHLSFRSGFSPIGTLPYPCMSSIHAIASVPCLSPGHLRRDVSRPVSYYALF